MNTEWYDIKVRDLNDELKDLDEKIGRLMSRRVSIEEKIAEIKDRTNESRAVETCVDSE